LMKESFRLTECNIKNGYDIIFIARNTINGKGFKDVSKSLDNALRRGKL
ncbi:MAG: ribonuclease P protein component, partial [Firmicutes bacterium]|nr:ribonuclease P protein component [Bacillota bacterium]